MTDESNDTDEKLRSRLRDRLDLKSEDGADSEGDSTEQKEEDIEAESDDHEDEEDEEMETEADATEAEADVEEIAAQVASLSDDITEQDAMEMLQPIVDGGDGTEQDAESELKAEDVDALVAEKLDEKLDERLDSLFGEKLDAHLDEKLDGLVSEDTLDEKLDTVVSALGEEVEETMQKADVGSTPDPGSGGGSELSTDDLLNGGDD